MSDSLAGLALHRKLPSVLPLPQTPAGRAGGMRTCLKPPSRSRLGSSCRGTGGTACGHRREDEYAEPRWGPTPIWCVPNGRQKDSNSRSSTRANSAERSEAPVRFRGGVRRRSRSRSFAIACDWVGEQSGAARQDGLRKDKVHQRKRVCRRFPVRRTLDMQDQSPVLRAGGVDQSWWVGGGRSLAESSSMAPVEDWLRAEVAGDVPCRWRRGFDCGDPVDRQLWICALQRRGMVWGDWCGSGPCLSGSAARRGKRKDASVCAAIGQMVHVGYVAGWSRYEWGGEAVRLDDLQQRVEGVVGKRMQEPSC